MGGLCIHVPLYINYCSVSHGWSLYTGSTVHQLLQCVPWVALVYFKVFLPFIPRTPLENAEDTKDQKESCGFTISPVWKASLRGSPITTTPILYDIDMDGYSDIIVATVTGEVWAVHGESGHVIDNWPFYLEGKSFHSSPLLVSGRFTVDSEYQSSSYGGAGLQDQILVIRECTLLVKVNGSSFAWEGLFGEEAVNSPFSPVLCDASHVVFLIPHFFQELVGGVVV